MDLDGLVRGLDKKRGFFHYKGSLTTPPCAEVVNWLVVDDPQPISYEQLMLFRREWEYNNTFALGNGNNRDV